VKVVANQHHQILEAFGVMGSRRPTFGDHGEKWRALDYDTRKRTFSFQITDELQVKEYWEWKREQKGFDISISLLSSAVSEIHICKILMVHIRDLLE
jgi:hypothetical protein